MILYSKFLSTKNILSFLFVLLLFSSCYYDNVDELHPAAGLQSCDTTGTVSYANDIAPILRDNCGTTNACHSTATGVNGYPLDNYDDLANQAALGFLVLDITHDPSRTRAQWMPNNCDCFLNKCGIEKIISWVNNGYPNN